jgi:hypothetical protein
MNELDLDRRVEAFDNGIAQQSSLRIMLQTTPCSRSTICAQPIRLLDAALGRDVILFVTDDASNVLDFRIGLDGDITPRDPSFTGLSVYDRDAAGVIVQTSNATGNTGFNSLHPSTTSGQAATRSPGFKAPNVPAQYARSDGFAVADGIAIHGVRTFDSNLGARTTPDAFAGDIHDPASQQSTCGTAEIPSTTLTPAGTAPKAKMGAWAASIGPL